MFFKILIRLAWAIFAFFGLGEYAFAQNSTRPVPAAAASSKSAMAKEIIANLKLNMELQNAVDAADKFFTREIKLKDPVAQANYKKAQKIAQQDFKKKVEAVKARTLDDLNKYFTNNFTDAELAYLTTASKYRVITKLIELLMAPEFNMIMEQPFAEASASIKDAKKKTVAPGLAPGTSEKK